MIAEMVQEGLSLLDDYLDVAHEASARARFAAGLHPLGSGVQMGEISLNQLLMLPLADRRDITEQGPIIDWYLGETRVYKRTTRTLLFAFCPDVGRHIEPLGGRFVIKLPHRFSNVLAVKLAVLYMEQYLLSPRIRTAPWRVEDDIATYIYLAELFAFIGLLDASRGVEEALFRRFQESPLQVEQIRAIWGRDNHVQPSKYVEAMADNIVTFSCIPKMHLFALDHDIEPEETYEEVVKKTMKRMKDAYPDKEGRNNRRIRYETTLLERLLAAPMNVALKQLVWTANSFTPVKPADITEWVEIRTVKTRLASQPHLSGMKKIVLARPNEIGTGEES